MIIHLVRAQNFRTCMCQGSSSVTFRKILRTYKLNDHLAVTEDHDCPSQKHDER